MPRSVLETLTAVARAVVVGTLAFGLPAMAADLHIAAWIAASLSLAAVGIWVWRRGWRTEGAALLSGSLGGLVIIGGLASALVLTS